MTTYSILLFALVLWTPQAQSTDDASQPAAAPQVDEPDQVVEPDPPKAPDLAALRAYRTRRLVRGSLHLSGTALTSVPVGAGSAMMAIPYASTSWTVYDGGGATLNSFEFAEAVGRLKMAEELRRKRKNNILVTIGIAGVGAGLLAGGMGISLADGADDQAFATGLVMMGVGIAGLSSAAIPAYRSGKFKTISKTFTPAKADVYIERHNAKLRTSLGLSEQDTADIDLGT